MAFNISQPIIDAYKAAHSYANGSPIPGSGSPQQIAQWAVDQQFISPSQANDYLAGQGITGNVIQTGTNGAGGLTSTGTAPASTTPLTSVSGGQQGVSISDSTGGLLNPLSPSGTASAPAQVAPQIPAGPLTTAPSITPSTNTSTASSAALPTYAQLVTAFQQQFGRAPTSGDEFNQWAAARGTPNWTNSPPPTNTATTGATTTTPPANPLTNLGDQTQSSLQAILAYYPQFVNAYQQYSGQLGQADLNNFRNQLYGSVDAGQFLQQHPEFQQGYQNAQASGQDPQAWLNNAVNNSTYIDQGTVPRGGGLFSINQALTNAANQQTISGNTALRQANINDATTLGPGALAAWQATNPGLTTALNQSAAATAAGIQPGALQGSLTNTFNQGPTYQSVSAGSNPFLTQAMSQFQNAGATPLSMDLTKMAQDQLALGSGLSDQQKRDAEQAAREAWGARGLINSVGAVGSEILNKDAYGQQLLNQRQQFAGNVNNQLLSGMQLGNQTGLGLLSAGATEANRGLQAGEANQTAAYNAAQQNNALGLGLMGSDYARQQQNIGNIFNNAQLQSANQFDPFRYVTSATTANQGTNTALFGQGGTASSGALGNNNLFGSLNPMNSYSSDFFNTQLNSQTSQNNAAANNQAGLQSGLLTGAAGLGAAALGATGTAATAGGVGSGLLAVKAFFVCIPDGQVIDTPEGQRPIEDIRAGDMVIGYDGVPVKVMQKHEYAENPDAVRFIKFTLDDRRSFSICDRHRIELLPSKEYAIDDLMGERVVTDKIYFGGVTRSYDLLTEDRGYRINGIPICSMIEELLAAAVGGI